MSNRSKKIHNVLDGIGFSVVTALAAATLFRVLSGDSNVQLPSVGVVKGVFSIVLVLVAAHFIFVFARNLPDELNSKSSQSNRKMQFKLRAVFIYGYIIMLASLCFASAPFFVPISDLSTNSDDQISAGIVVAYKPEYVNSEEVHPQWYVYIGSSVTEMEEQTGLDESSNVFVLHGGLIVPLYVVVLALMGGAINMIRRVPEYQRRVVGDNRVIEDNELISPIRARELIVFQIMQLFSAPLLAFTAFAVIDPQLPMSGALLGFFSGFASETILLRLRSAAESISENLDKAEENKQK